MARSFLGGSHVYAPSRVRQQNVAKTDQGACLDAADFRGVDSDAAAAWLRLGKCGFSDARKAAWPASASPLFCFLFSGGREDGIAARVIVYGRGPIRETPDTAQAQTQ